MSQFYLTAFQLSLCLGPMALGIFITMKVFNIPDITTDGSYTLGAVVTAVLLTNHWTAIAALPVVMGTGALAGICTGLIHTKLKIDALLAGILVMTGLYSVNLTILGRSNVPLINMHTIFNTLSIFSTGLYNQLFVALIIMSLLMFLLRYVLSTDFGIAMRATGNNPIMTKSMGINNDMIKIIGLALANALTALSGFLVSQYQNFADINMGIGIVITGLGSVLIADALRIWMNVTNIGMQILLVLAGSILFQMVLAFTLAIGVDPNLLKGVTAVFVLIIVALPRVSGQLKSGLSNNRKLGAR
jgi:putative ABC transport system permease protein